VRLVAVAPNPSIDRLLELDRLVRDAVNRPLVETLVAGGKGLNVARAAHALGAEATVVALLAGHAGAWMADALETEGIAGRFAWAGGETRTCIAIHDRADGTLTEVNEAGPEVDRSTWRGLVELLRAEIAAGDVELVTISGTLPPGVPPDGLAELARVAREGDVAVALDAAGSPLAAALGTTPWLVKLNAAEARATLGDEGAALTPGSTDDEAEALALARRIAARSAGAVVVTRGAEGALAIDADGSAFRVGAASIRGPYPVGSGDAFLAGLAVGRLRGSSIGDSLGLAGAAAAANALTRGAGRLDPADVARLGSSILVESLAV